MKKKVYYITINDLDETGMDAISLVDCPAVQYDFLCFNEEKKPVQLKFDDAKHIITGVVALADTPIYRYNPTMGEYYIIFSKETIQKMVEKYSKMGLWNSINLQHDDTKFIDGVYMIESYLTDKERGIAPIEFSNVPEGSWIASFKVEDDNLWNEIINGENLNGFSLQGIFDLTEQKFNSEKHEETFEDWINNYLK